MTKELLRSHGYAAAVAGAVFLALLTGCNKSPPEIQTVAAPAAAPAPTTVVQVGVGLVPQDEYIYYPAYEVYFNPYQRQYVYRDTNAWVMRSAPPRVSVDVLFASPSVRLEFHDAPARHHATVVQNYPRNWAPPGAGRGERDEHRPDRKERR